MILVIFNLFINILTLFKHAPIYLQIYDRQVFLAILTIAAEIVYTYS